MHPSAGRASALHRADLPRRSLQSLWNSVAYRLDPPNATAIAQGEGGSQQCSAAAAASFFSSRSVASQLQRTGHGYIALYHVYEHMQTGSALRIPQRRKRRKHTCCSNPDCFIGLINLTRISAKLCRSWEMLMSNSVNAHALRVVCAVYCVNRIRV